MATRGVKSDSMQAWKSHEEKLTQSQMIANYLSNSCLQLSVEEDWTGSPIKLVIVVSGKLASFPAIKNSKHILPNGRVVINSDYQARLKALDKLFFEKSFQKNCSFGTTPVWCSVVCGKRNVRFDADNCFSSMTDWLEPNFKIVNNKKNQRGWGVGVVEDDSQVSGICIKGVSLGLSTSDSIISVSRWVDVNIKVLDFMSSTVEDYKNIKQRRAK